MNWRKFKGESYISFILLVVVLSCMGTQCNKDLIPGNYYQFQDKVDLYPSQKSYYIGDTIWVSYTNQSKNFYDQITSSTIHIDTASVTFQLSIQTPDFAYPHIPAGGICDIVSIGNGSMPEILDSVPEIVELYGCNPNNNYDFKIGIILKQKGVFQISLEGVDKTVDACQNKIEKLPPAAIHFTFNLSDCNKDVYNALPHNLIGFFSAQEIDGKRSFIFNVK